MLVLVIGLLAATLGRYEYINRESGAFRVDRFTGRTYVLRKNLAGGFEWAKLPTPEEANAAAARAWGQPSSPVPQSSPR